MKYRKKPIELEAFQWNGSLLSLPGWALNAAKCKHDSESLFINTLEGEMECRLKDWLIQGIKGEIYPCKPDIFDATYTKVEV